MLEEMQPKNSRKHKNMWVKLLWTTQRKQENTQSAEPYQKKKWGSEREIERDRELKKQLIAFPVEG